MFQTGILRPSKGGQGSPQVTQQVTGRASSKARADAFSDSPVAAESRLEQRLLHLELEAPSSLPSSTQILKALGRLVPHLYTTRKFVVVLRNTQVCPQFPSYPILKLPSRYGLLSQR